MLKKFPKFIKLKGCCSLVVIGVINFGKRR